MKITAAVLHRHKIRPSAMSCTWVSANPRSTTGWGGQMLGKKGLGDAHCELA